MKCKSCQGEVPPKFAHAILINMCPLCGDTIMDETLQISLKALKEAMCAVAFYPQEIFDWLKSNYGLYSEEEVAAKLKEVEAKTTEAVKASYAGKVVHNNKVLPNPSEPTKQIELDKDGNQIAGPSLQANEQTNKFFKNAAANKALDNQQHYQKLAKEIRKNGSPALLSEGGAAGVITPDMAESMGEVDPVELAELRAAFGDTDVNSGLDPSDIDYEDEIPSIVMNMANKASGGQGMNQKDLLKLQNLQHKSASAKNAMARTGSVGLIRR